MKIQDLLSESGTVSATTSGNVPGLANPGLAKKKVKKQPAGLNALDSKNNLMTGTVIKR